MNPCEGCPMWATCNQEEYCPARIKYESGWPEDPYE